MNVDTATVDTPITFLMRKKSMKSEQVFSFNFIIFKKNR